jgi:hypothetical protein
MLLILIPYWLLIVFALVLIGFALVLILLTMAQIGRILNLLYQFLYHG